MDETTLTVITIMSAFISLSVLIYVIVLIKKIEYNTRAESHIFMEDCLLKHIIMNNTTEAKKYIDEMFAAEIISAKYIYNTYSDKNAFARVFDKYKNIYSRYNIVAPSDFEDYSKLEFIKTKLNIR